MEEMCTMGKLIVFEGIDGSGKSTQSGLVRSRLKEEGVEFRSVTFPRYDNPSASLIKMYLGGEFGSNPNDVNAYAASCFYAVDRYASFVQDWREYYNNGGIIIMDRYTTSNAIHQSAKIEESKREEYLRWLSDFEFNLLGLPTPDAVMYMDIPFELALKRISGREAATGTTGDIHEKDTEYLKMCHKCGLQAAEIYGWNKVALVKDGVERSIDEIHEEIFGLVKGIISNE